MLGVESMTRWKGEMKSGDEGGEGGSAKGFFGGEDGKKAKGETREEPFSGRKHGPLMTLFLLIVAGPVSSLRRPCQRRRR